VQFVGVDAGLEGRGGDVVGGKMLGEGVGGFEGTGGGGWFASEEGVVGGGI